MKQKIFFCVAAILLGIAEISATTYYVKPDGNDADDGLSWETARASIMGALDVANPRVDQIFVAQGDYSITIPIIPLPGINVYGGFAGNETSLEERPHLTFGKTATGRASVLDAHSSENELRRVIHQQGPLTTETIYDGFVIQNGFATDQSVGGEGGGVYLDINGHLNNCTVSGCRSLLGGGVYCKQDATVSNCYITDNRALGKGGGIACSNGSQAVNCYIVNNVSDVEAGGAYAGRDGSKGSALINCVIANNTAVLGGGVYCSIAGIVNCTIVNNRATENGGGLLAYANYPVLINTILWGNTKSVDGAAQINGVDGNTKSAAYCAVQGGYGGNGADNITNLEVTNSGNDAGKFYPQFRNPVTQVGAVTSPADIAAVQGADWRLNESSAAKNLGTQTVDMPNTSTVEYAAIIIPDIDLNGHARINEGVIDLGPYEITALSTDATLANLTVSAGELTPAFTPEQTAYTVSVESEVTSIFLDAIENQFNEKIAGTGEKTLSTGDNTFTITVTAEDGVAQKTYTIVVSQDEGTGIQATAPAVSVKIYPNPVSDKLVIETPNQATPEIKLYNLQGKLLLQTQSNEIDLSGFEAGTYLLKANGETIKLVRK
jgi:hypothetical protein